jgi:hypothetical protein
MPRMRKPRFDAPGKARTLTLQTAQHARHAKRELVVLVPLLALTLYFYLRREQLFGVDTPVRVGAAIVMVVLGWALARISGGSRRRRCSGAWIPRPRAPSAS